MTFKDICEKACNSENALLVQSGRIAFRNLLDPYCAEWSSNSNEERLEIISLLDTIDVPLILLCKEFQSQFNKWERPDIAASCADGLAILLQNTVRQVL